MANTVTPDGIRIRKLRIRRGWTQEQLAEIAGVSTRSIQRAEGGSAASLETLRALAGAFEIEIAELLAAEADGAVSAQTRGDDCADGPDETVPPAPSRVEEVTLVHPGFDRRALPHPRLALRFAAAPELAVLAMSIVALVSAIAYVGHGWSSRYTPTGLPAEAAITAVPPTLSRPVNDVVESVMPDRSEASRPGAGVLVRAGIPADAADSSANREAGGMTLRPNAPVEVMIEAPHATAAWREPAPTVRETAAELPLLAAERPGFSPTRPPFPNGLSVAPAAPATDERSDLGAVAVALRVAGKKTGGFFARAGFSIGASMKAVF